MIFISLGTGLGAGVIISKKTGENLYPLLKENEKKIPKLEQWDERALSRIMLRMYGAWVYPGANHIGGPVPYILQPDEYRTAAPGSRKPRKVFIPLYGRTVRASLSLRRGDGSVIFAGHGWKRRPSHTNVKRLPARGLAPMESKTVTFQITEDMLKFYTADMTYAAEPGLFRVYISPNAEAEAFAEFSVG